MRTPVAHERPSASRAPRSSRSWGTSTTARPRCSTNPPHPVASGEAGGITQHIGAYRCRRTTADHVPRHAGPRGVHGDACPRRALTDIVVLVVAADDGVMPQTIEAIHHARRPKCRSSSRSTRSTRRTRIPTASQRTSSAQNLIPEEWGGETSSSPSRRSTGAGVDQLLETILLQAEVLDLKSYRQRVSRCRRGARVEHREGPRPGRDRAGPDGHAPARRPRAAGGRVRARTSAVRCHAASSVDAGRAGGAGAGASAVGRAECGRRPACARRKRAQGARSRADPPGQVPRRAPRQAARRSSKTSSAQMGENAAQSIHADRQGRRAGQRRGAAATRWSRSAPRRSRSRHRPAAWASITESDVSLAAASKARIVGFNVRADGAARSATRTRRRRPVLQHHLRGHRRRAASLFPAC